MTFQQVPKELWLCRDYSLFDRPYTDRAEGLQRECSGGCGTPPCAMYGVTCSGPVLYKLVEEDVVMPEDIRPPEAIPATLEKAVKAIIENSAPKNPKVIVKWMEQPEAEATTDSHHNVGTVIRNQWKLWEGSKLALHLYNRFGLTHPDDMSGLILTCTHREMNYLPWDAEGEAQRYLDFWAKQSGGLPPVPWVNEKV